MLQRHPIKGCTPNRPGGSSSTYGCRTSCQLGWPLHCGHRTGGRSSSMHELSYWRTRSPDVWRIFMKFLGFQIPNYTFPGVTNDRLFDHVAMLANTAERAGVDLERHCEAVGRDPWTIVKTHLGSLIIRKTDAEAERLYEQLLNRPGGQPGLGSRRVHRRRPRSCRRASPDAARCRTRWPDLQHAAHGGPRGHRAGGRDACRPSAASGGSIPSTDG